MTKPIQKKLLLAFTMLTLTFCFQKSVSAQQDFTLHIHSNASGYTLQCESGCTWKTLEWKIGDKMTQLVSKTGITDNLTKQLDNKDDFAFQLVKTDKGFDFVSLQGTAWNTLNYSCPGKTCSIIVNKSGVFGE